MTTNDDSYHVFPPKWRWFTRIHYLVTENTSYSYFSSSNLKLSNKWSYYSRRHGLQGGLPLSRFYWEQKWWKFGKRYKDTCEMIDLRKGLRFPTDVNVTIISFLESGFSQFKSCPTPHPAGQFSCLKVSRDVIHVRTSLVFSKTHCEVFKNVRMP